MDITPLIETNPGLIALGILILGVILLAAWVIKFRSNAYFFVLALIVFVLGVVFAAAVLGYVELPLIEYFNVPTSVPATG